MWILLWVLSAISFGYAASIAAGFRGRNTLLWYWFGCAGLGFSLLLVMHLPPRDVGPNPP